MTNAEFLERVPEPWREQAAIYSDAMKDLPPEDYQQSLERFVRNVSMRSPDDVPLTPAQREAELAKPPKPQPKKNDIVAAVRAQLKAEAPAREAQYQKAARPLSKKYGLDIESDRSRLKKLIAAGQRLEVCASCAGNCFFPEMREFETYSISATGEVSWVPCQIEVKRRVAEKIPKKFAAKTFDDYEQTPDNRRAIGMAHWFLDGGDRGLYLYGGVGTGKTFLASLIAKRLIQSGKYVQFRNMPALLGDLKETFNNPQLSSQTVLRKFQTAEVLILDDVGAGKLSDWNVEILFRLLNYRIEAEKPTVITSNYSAEELLRKISAVPYVDVQDANRIISRLKGACHFAHLGNRDRRQ